MYAAANLLNALLQGGDVMDFKDWFCLNARDSFTIDPQINPEDAQFYFGRQEKLKDLKSQLRKSFIDPGVPKIFIYGSIWLTICDMTLLSH
jgi:hypothetical protein